MSGQVEAWPEAPDERRDLIDGVEEELVFAHVRYQFVRLADASASTAVTSGTSDTGDAARALFAWCRGGIGAHGEDPDAMFGPRVAADLHRALARRIRELVARGEAPRAWEDPCALSWPLLVRSIIACIAASAPASDPSAQREGISTLLPRLVNEVHHVIADARSSRELVLRMLRQRDRLRLCRHYSRALAVLFTAVMSVAGRNEPVFAIEVTGRPFFTSSNGHSWNWFVDLAHAQILAIDLSGAIASRSTRDDVFGTRLDWMAMNNVSAFLHCLFLDVWRRGGAAIVRHAIPQLIDPGTLRGQSLLYRLAQHQHLIAGARARIVRGLERRGFDEAVPDWRRIIENVPASPLLHRGVRATFGEGTAQLELLDAIGL